MVKNFRRRRTLEEEDGEEGTGEEARVSLSVDEIRMIQKQRERTKGIPAGLAAAVAGPKAAQPEEEAVGEGEEGGEELVLQDTFAQESETAVEDPNMLKYVEQELAKRRGQAVDANGKTDEDKKAAEEGALYAIPEHLQVKKLEGDEGQTAWTTGIAEVQLPVEYKLKNIEETEQAKRAMAERRPFYKSRQQQTTLPASFSADFYQRGRDYAEKMRQANADQFGGRGGGGGMGGRGMGGGMGGGPGGPGGGGGDHQHHHGGEPRRQTATDDIMLERFRKRERNRMMRR